MDFVGRVVEMLARDTAQRALELWVDDGSWWIRASGGRRRGRAERVGAETRGLDLATMSRLAGLEVIGREPGRMVARTTTRPHTEVSVVRLAAGGMTGGWLMVEAADEDYLTRREAERFARLSELLAITLMSQKGQAELRERVKELGGLYRISESARRLGPDFGLDATLDRIASRLGEAWQYPDIAIAWITFDGVRVPAAPLTRPLAAVQQTPLEIDGRVRGEVAVAYTEERPVLDEGPFLSDERHLLDAVATLVASIVSQHEAEEEQRRLREQLTHAERLATVGKLAAGVAHELNEPLGAVLGYCQLMKSHHEEGDADWDDLGKIEAAALHGREIVRKLLLFARRTPAERRPVVVAEVVEEAVNLVAGRIRHGHAEVLTVHDPVRPAVMADPGQLRQVVVNLVANGLDAVEDDGRVEIATRREGGEVVIEVADTGTGIPPEVRDTMFLPFVTTREVDEGTGLGLAVVHGIVEAHDGVLEVESTPGEGACFRVRLPAADPT